jgi:aminopeptidase N
MADANGEDLSGIGRWYSQAGTPTLSVATAYDAAKRTFTITTHQVRSEQFMSSLMVALGWVGWVVCAAACFLTHTHARTVALS